MKNSMPFKGTDSTFQRSAKEMFSPLEGTVWNRTVNKPGFRIDRITPSGRR